MSTHHKYSPSSLELYEACAMYEKQVWDDTTAADEGTMMHNVLETGDRRLIETSEQEAQINKAFKIIADLKAEIGEGFTEYKEMRLKVHFDDEEITRGTTDLVLVSADGTKAILADYKFGIMPITLVKDNLQVQAYVAGLLQQIPTLEVVLGVLIAPRQSFYDRFEYTREDLPKIVDRITQTINKRENPFRLPTCDESACALCGLRGQCPALNNTAVAAIKGLGSLPMPSEFEAGKLATPLDRAKAQVLAKVLEKWAVDVRKYNTAAVYEHGEELPPGFALRKRSGGFGIDNNYLSELLPRLTEKYKFDPADPEFLSCFSLSAAKLGTFLSNLTGENKKDLLQMLSDDVPEIVRERADVIYLQKKSKKITDEQILLGEITST